MKNTLNITQDCNDNIYSGTGVNIYDYSTTVEGLMSLELTQQGSAVRKRKVESLVQTSSLSTKSINLHRSLTPEPHPPPGSSKPASTDILNLWGNYVYTKSCIKIHKKLDLNKFLFNSYAAITQNLTGFLFSSSRWPGCSSSPTSPVYVELYTL